MARRGSETFAEYAPRWIADRPGLAPRTLELYKSEPRCHIVPVFGAQTLASIKIEQVRTWRADVERATSATTAAKVLPVAASDHGHR